MKIPDDVAHTLSTEDVKGIVLFFMDETWGEDETVSVPAWEAWLESVKLETYEEGWEANY